VFCFSPSSFSSTADPFSIAIFLLPTSPVLPLSLDRLFSPPDFSFPSPIFVQLSFPLRGDQLTCSAVDLQHKATNLQLGRPRSHSLRHFSLPDLFSNILWSPVVVREVTSSRFCSCCSLSALAPSSSARGVLSQFCCSCYLCLATSKCLHLILPISESFCR
jgi:hypothetical protein